ncbi:MAG: hypothetical protein ACUVSZ_10680, partial [Chloroflexus sp.]
IYCEGISFIAEQFHDRDEHTRHSRDQPGQRPDTCQIASTADAAAMLPHSKRRDKRMMSGQGNHLWCMIALEMVVRARQYSVL